MQKLILVFLFLCTMVSHAQADEASKAFKAIDSLFLAMSEVDYGKMKNNVTDSFILLEHGEVWSIEDLIKVVKPSDYVRTNYFSIININVKGDVAIANYWNKANFSNKVNSEDVVWLESAVLERTKGIWRLSQMHSTRLPPGEVPEGVVFLRQAI